MKYRSDKGVAGLSILLSLVVMLFIIGLIVMIFSLMGNALQDATYTTTNVSVVNESIASPTTAGVTLAGGYAIDGVCAGITKMINGSTDPAGVNIVLANVTQTNCLLKNTTWTDWSDYNLGVRVTYSYLYSASNDATTTINDTISAVAGVTDWFNIFIVIGAMVVLILLTVIIITAIKGSGMVGGETSGAKGIGTA